MAVSLQKGGNVSLSKEAPGLTEVIVGLGWDPRVTDGTEFDLDASVFVTGENGKVLNDASFIFYNNKTSADGSIEHLGDNRSGQGDGDDEQVNVKLNGLGADVKKLVFAVTIHDAEARKQSFGQVGNAYIRVLNKADGKEIARFDLSEDASTETAMIFGELYRHNDEFKFKAIGQGFAGGLKPLAEAHGVSIG
ncbi:MULTISPECIES: TerD family protein [Pseudomonadaceae]|jgi:tellurium resistance protein TerD|uniref:Tellurium resistance protein n=7 Tax=Gammaproteobacteria TaxID=1236 RepID=A0A653B8W3_ECTOL|nr:MULTISPECIES: TerD family protein [Pseudomonadaceae]KEA27746.1 chemical-damaging agent resistance protein C [Pseudomonas aeruginosa C0324C]KFJ91799.1 chemical-damaging agent resistance protein C [Pseudomonas sp. 1-7]CAE6905812.1 Tellurium resistance protein TerE [Pseudomonas oleovorans]ACD39194.1 tellurium resistance protein [Pseudomonas aeruginosa]ACY75541.1 tellurium-resistance protein [Pseudomonas aeruginosa]|tara:strand:- start:5177 stop:5755 length:579 start_codon:yes stop_codon:yes gene_type:complete